MRVPANFFKHSLLVTSLFCMGQGISAQATDETGQLKILKKATRQLGKADFSEFSQPLDRDRKNMISAIHQLGKNPNLDLDAYQKLVRVGTLLMKDYGDFVETVDKDDNEETYNSKALSRMVESTPLLIALTLKISPTIFATGSEKDRLKMLEILVDAGALVHETAQVTEKATALMDMDDSDLEKFKVGFDLVRKAIKAQMNEVKRSDKSYRLTKAAIMAESKLDSLMIKSSEEEIVPIKSTSTRHFLSKTGVPFISKLIANSLRSLWEGMAGITAFAH